MNIIALTGSGISAASGIATYREAGSGWDEYANGKAHYTRYGNHLDELWQHWTEKGLTMAGAEPNAAHYALAEAGASIITQNVDGLHTRAGSTEVSELHGNMQTLKCLRCRKVSPCDFSTERPHCQHCDSLRVRPNIILFGEPLSEQKVMNALQDIMVADIIMVIGTSGAVYPARELVDTALMLSMFSDKKTVLFDIKAWDQSDAFSEIILGPAEKTVPEYLEQLQ